MINNENDGEDLEREARLEIAKERERERQRARWREELERKAEKSRPRRERDLRYIEAKKAEEERTPSISDIFNRYVEVAGEEATYNEARKMGETPGLRTLPTGETVVFCDDCGKSSAPIASAEEGFAQWHQHRRAVHGG